MVTPGRTLSVMGQCGNKCMDILCNVKCVIKNSQNFHIKRHSISRITLNSHPYRNTYPVTLQIKKSIKSMIYSTVEINLE